MRNYLFVLFVLGIGTAAAAVDDREQHPSVQAVPTTIPPSIDGFFDPDEWKGAAILSGFKQVIPKEGAEPSEVTIANVLFDSDNLYVAIQCFDKNPQGIVAKQMQKEVDYSSDDIVELVIDPFGDKRNGYYFTVSAGGGKIDGLVVQGNTVNNLWDTVWLAKVSVNDKGWVAEIAIPYKSISYRGGSPNWGINIQRTIRRTQELSRWSAPTRNQNFLDMVQTGTLSGLVGLKQGVGLTLKPYASVFADLNNGHMFLRPGFDMAYKITPATTAIITVNTDFAEAEIDDLTVTLSRFPIFFPEKRAFFLQDASVFAFGGIGQSPLPFYSRRIGSANGQRKDMLAGVKVTGREGFLNFGVLDVQMYDDADLGAKNLSVGRVLANVFDQSTAGLIVTHGDPSTTGDSTLFGTDFNYQNSHVFGDQTLTGHLWDE